MRVGEFCTREVVVVGKHNTIVEAARLMRDYHVGDLVVVEEKNGERVPMGILTDRDIVVGVIAVEPDRMHSLLVGDIMSLELMTAQEDENLSDVLKRMGSSGVRRIPVVNRAGGLEGILSIDDYIEQVCEEMMDMVKLITVQRKRESLLRS